MAAVTVGEQVINITPSIGAASGTDPQQEATTFGSVTITCDLDGAAIAMVVGGDSAEAGYIDELASDLWLLGDVPMRFRLWAVWQDWDASGDDRISLQGVTYKRLLNRRLVGPGGLNFAAGTDAGSILWGLWQHTQAKPGGNLAVTAGSYTTGATAERNYVEGDNLGDLASQLSEALDVWWDVDSDLVFSAGQLSTIDYIAQPLQLGVNVDAMQRASGGAEYADSVFGSGAIGTAGSWSTDPDIATNPRGLWERARGWPTVSKQDTLDEHVDGALAESMQMLSHWNIDMNAERWVTDSRLMPGDFAVLVVPRSLAAPIGVPTDRVAVQVTSTVINFTGDGDFNVKLVASERDRALPSS